jgi:ArsR family transcriptional regulator
MFESVKMSALQRSRDRKQASALKAFAALSDETRLKIVRVLVAGGREGTSAGAIAKAAETSPSSASCHLATLKSAGLIDSHREGRSRIYRLQNHAIEEIEQFCRELVIPLDAEKTELDFQALSALQKENPSPALARIHCTGLAPSEFEVLSWGLRGWMFDPKTPLTIENSLRVGIATELSKFVDEEIEVWDDPSEALVRVLNRPGCDWLCQAHFALGGLWGLAEATSRGGLLGRYLDHQKDFLKLLPVLKLLHAHHLSPNAHTVSERKAIWVASSPEFRGIWVLPTVPKVDRTDKPKAVVDPRTVREHWNQFRPSLAFLYAAHNMPGRGQMTLLRTMCGNAFLPRDIEPALAPWIGRARYFDRLVVRWFPDGTPLNFPDWAPEIEIHPPAELASHLDMVARALSKP